MVWHVAPHVMRGLVCRLHLVPVDVVPETQEHLGEKLHPEVVHTSRLYSGDLLDIFCRSGPSKQLHKAKSVPAYSEAGKSGGGKVYIAARGKLGGGIKEPLDKATLEGTP